MIRKHYICLGWHNDTLYHKCVFCYSAFRIVVELCCQSLLSTIRCQSRDGAKYCITPTFDMDQQSKKGTVFNYKRVQYMCNGKK